MRRLSTAQLSRLFLCIALLFVATCYVGSLWNGPVCDDAVPTLHNPNFASVPRAPNLLDHNIPCASDASQHSRFYQPFAALSLVLNRVLLGNSPLSYHAGNILLHLAVFCALWVTLQQLLNNRNPGAMVSSLGFAVAAVNSEPVLWISGRFELLGALAALLSVSANGLDGPLATCAVLASFAIALLSKESLVVFLLIILTQDLLLLRRSARNLWPKYLGLLALVAGLLLLLARRDTLSFGSVLDIPFSELLRSYAFTLYTLLRLALLPFGLNAFHAYHPFALWVTVSILCVVFASVLALGLALRRSPANRHLRLALWGLLWYLISIIPVSIAVPELCVLGDGSAYIPLLGVCIALSPFVQWCFEALESLSQPKRLQIALAGALGLVWVVQGWAVVDRTKDWKSDTNLFEAALREDPNNVHGLYGLGVAYATAGDYARAERFLTKSAAADSSSPRTQAALCFTLLNLGRLGEAQQACERSAAANPNDPAVWVSLGSIAVRKGEWSQVVSFASNAIKGDPSLAEALYLRALGLFNLGRIDEARIALASCLEIDPRHEGASKLKSQWVERGLWHESP